MDYLFDWIYYVNTYQDLLDSNISTKEAAYDHWINNGKNEGRSCNILFDIFDWEFYINRYSDLYKNGVDTEEKAINHWIYFGKKEKRICNNDNFNPVFYMNYYQDLNNNNINTTQLAILHWVKYGKAEGRICNNIITINKDNIKKLSNRFNIVNNDQLINDYSLSNIKLVENKNEVKVQPKNEVKVEPKNEVKNEVKVEPKNEVKNEVKVEPKNEVKVDPKNKVKVEPKNEVKNEVKVEPKNEVKVEVKVEPKNEVKNEVKNKENFIKSESKEVILKLDIRDESKYLILDSYNKDKWRLFCSKNLRYLQNFDLPKISSPTCIINAVMIEFRVLDNIEFIIRNCMLKLKNRCIYTVVCGNNNFEQIKDINKNLDNRLHVIKLDYNNITINQYSNILTTSTFWENLKGSYILLYQEDSIIFKSNIEDFIRFDYIGAPWPKTQNDNINLVGNGGFSLRNKQIMIDICKKYNPLFYTYNSSTIEYMKSCNLVFPPEDVFFSKCMIDNNIGIVADWDSASLFSSESICNYNSFGGHCFWIADPKCENRLYNNILIKFKPIYDLTDIEHRGGWKDVILNLVNSGIYSDRSNYYFFDIIEQQFLWNKDYVCKDLWCGIIHCTFITPNYLNECNITNLFKNNNFILSLKYCFAIFTLSKYLKKELDKKFKELFIEVKVFYLKHPIDTYNLPLFNINEYIANNNKMIIQIGQQLRIMSTIYRINVLNHSKLWLTGTKKFSKIHRLLENEIIYLNLENINIHNVSMSYTSTIADYDYLLSRNIVIINLFDASANNVIIECIIRNTPIFINKLESVVEYLGEDYPLYFNDLNEFEDESFYSSDRIIKAHIYLKNMDKEDLTLSHFNNRLLNDIYTSINEFMSKQKV